MTNLSSHIPEQHSAISNFIVAALTGGMIVLAGFLSIAQFAIA